tara:strand:- start:631 stop:894 length:264 start_codon:yes stop_codon:yes gene_type:complete
MNSKKLKELRKKVKPIQVEWLQSVLPDDQKDKVNVNNVDDLLPEQTHVVGGGQLYVSYMTDKWIMNILKKHPYISSFEEIQCYTKLK